MAGALVVLFSFGILGCASNNRRQLIVVPGARDVRFAPNSDFESAVIYEVTDPYPATLTIERMNKKLESRGWIERNKNEQWILFNQQNYVRTSIWTREKESYSYFLGYYIDDGEDVKEANRLKVFCRYEKFETEIHEELGNYPLTPQE